MTPPKPSSTGGNGTNSNASAASNDSCASKSSNGSNGSSPKRAWEQVDTLRRKIADWQILAGDIIANDHELDDNMRSRLRHYRATHPSHIH